MFVGQACRVSTRPKVIVVLPLQPLDLKSRVIPLRQALQRIAQVVRVQALTEWSLMIRWLTA